MPFCLVTNNAFLWCTFVYKYKYLYLASSTSTRTQVQLQVHVYFLQRYRHSRCAVVHWLLSLFIAHLVVSGVRVSVSFQIIPRVVGRLGSEVQFSKFCVKKVYPSRHVFTVPSAVPCVRKVSFLSRLCCHVLGDPTMAPLCAVACFLRTLGMHPLLSSARKEVANSSATG